MATVSKRITGYPSNGKKFSTIYTSPPGGLGTWLLDLLYSHAGSYYGDNAPRQVTVGVKASGSTNIDVISAGNTVATTITNKNLLSNKMFLNAGDSIVANSPNNMIFRPINTSFKFAANGITLFLSNLDGSILVAAGGNKIYVSVDQCRTWILKYSTGTFMTNPVGMFFKGEFFIGGSESTMVRSTDANTWTPVAITPRAFKNFGDRSGSTVSNSTYAYRVSTQSGDVLYRTSDGVNWVTTGISIGAPVISVFVDDTYILVPGSAGTSDAMIAYAYDTTSGTEIGRSTFSGTSASKPKQIGKLGSHYWVLFNSQLLSGTVPHSTLTSKLAICDEAIFLPNIVIYKASNFWYYAELQPDGTTLGTPIQIDFSIALAQFQAYLGRVATSVKLILNGTDDLLYETVDLLGTACAGTTLTLSLVETSA